MDQRLQRRTNAIDQQIDALYEIAQKYYTLDAAKDHKLAVLETNLPGEMSEAKRTRLAKADPAWLNFKDALASAAASHERQKHKLELRHKEYDGEHVTFKAEGAAIKRQVG